jgi:ribokinase
MSRVVVVGSANTDHIVRVSRLPGIGETVLGSSYLVAAGGKGLNQTVAAARLGARVAFVGCIGADRGGAELAQLLDDEGVELTGLRTVADTPSGIALITVSDDGSNTIVVAPLANQRVSVDDIADVAGLVAEAAVLLTQLEIPLRVVEEALAQARAAGAITVLNPAPAPPGGLPRAILKLVDVLVPNENELATLTRLPLVEGAQSLLAAGCGTVVVTLGEAGAVAVTRSGTLMIPALPVTPVDTTAAGDAFCGALAAGLAFGLPLETALRRAAAAGALATTRPGAVPSLPTAAEVEELLAD